MPRARAVMLCLTLVVGIDAGSPRPPHPRAPRRPGLAAERSRICCQQDKEPAPPPLTAFALASAPAAAAAAVGEGWFVAVLAPFLLLANTVEAPPFAALLRRRLSLPRLVSPPRAPVLPHCLSASSPPVLLLHTPSSTCRSHGHCVAALRCLPSPPQRGARVRRGRGSAQPPGGLCHPCPAALAVAVLTAAASPPALTAAPRTAAALARAALPLPQRGRQAAALSEPMFSSFIKISRDFSPRGGRPCRRDRSP